MRVLHVFKTYLPETVGGIEQSIWELAEGTAALGVENHVMSLSRSPGTAPQRMGGHITHPAKLDLYVASTGISLSAFGLFRELASDMDIVHYHFPWPTMDLMHMVVRPKARTVVTYHSDIVRQKALLTAYRPLMNAFLKDVDCIVATSPNYVRTSSVLARHAAKTICIPLGMRDRIAPSEAAVSQWRDRIGEGFFLFVGALRYYKGLPFLLEAARTTNARIVIAGDGPALPDLRRGAPDNVTFLGQVSDEDKEALLDLAAAFVFPSHLRSEAFGMSLLEAARAGKAMISCEIGTGTSFVNLDAVTGIVVPPANPGAIADAMTRLLGSPHARKAFGAAARARYLERFTAEGMSASYADLYRRLVGP